MGIREMVYHALGVTDEEHEQMNAWREKNKVDQKDGKGREGSALATAGSEFTRNATEVAEQMHRMDHQAMMMAQRQQELASAKDDNDKSGEFEA